MRKNGCSKLITLHTQQSPRQLENALKGGAMKLKKS